MTFDELVIGTKTAKWEENKSLCFVALALFVCRQIGTDAILHLSFFKGEVLYRVRWKNYCSDDDTWEPEAHLEDCREVLLAFKNSMAEAKVKKEPEAKKITVS